MNQASPIDTFKLLKGVLSHDDIAYLKERCREYIMNEYSIPSYVLLDALESRACRKIFASIQESVGTDVFYLNDFYIYSDSAAAAGWHMDTELFTFEECINAWILLSPDELGSPLAALESPNESPDNYFHSAVIEGETCTFRNYRTGKSNSVALGQVESDKINAPPVQVGDILLLNPKKFHRTNTTKPKHALVLKFVIEGRDGFFSDSKVPPMFWSEVAIFTDLLKKSRDWNAFLEALRETLKTPKGRKALSAGFFPERMDLYRKMVAAL